jgi:glycosyltransferase involved in cell wall biosynthesis
MGNRMKILAVTNNFPTTRFPEKGVFVMNILKEMSRQGVEVDVIAPVSVGTELKRFNRKTAALDFSGLKVRQPYYISIPQRFPRFRKSITRVNDWLFGLSLRIAFNKKEKYDFVYCHFLQSAIPVIQGLQTRDIPTLVNIGESDPWDYELSYSKQTVSYFLKSVDYIVTVSKINYDYILSLDSSLYVKTKYIPNGVDINFFKPYDKISARKKLGLDLNTKYIVFCGHFDERKGPLRVLEAIKDTEIKGVFLGSNGSSTPIGKEVAFAGAVNNKDIVYYLSACDAFVLPSLSEGMSNAVLEAMACCTPMVISNLPFNTDFIQEDCASFVDPKNIESIRNGIFAALNEVNNNNMRKSLSLVRENISIETRIKKIFDFILENR